MVSFESDETAARIGEAEGAQSRLFCETLPSTEKTSKIPLLSFRISQTFTEPSNEAVAKRLSSEDRENLTRQIVLECLMSSRLSGKQVDENSFLLVSNSVEGKRPAESDPRLERVVLVQVGVLLVSGRSPRAIRFRRLRSFYRVSLSIR